MCQVKGLADENNPSFQHVHLEWASHSSKKFKMEDMSETVSGSPKLQLITIINVTDHLVDILQLFCCDQ